MTQKRIVLDLETPRSFADVGGHQNMHLLGVSVVGVYFYDTDSYRAFRVEDLPEFEEYLLAHRPEIVGFNQRHFDLPVLQPYCSRAILTDLPQVDILAEVAAKEGIRIKLESFAQATLLEGKTGHGLEAVAFYRAGQWDKLEKYCLDDVRLTKDLYDYGARHGHIWYKSGAEMRKVDVSWKQTPTISDLLEKAQEQHQKVQVEVIELLETGAVRQESVFDVRMIHNGSAVVYCHRTQRERTLPLSRIFSAGLLQESSVHQTQLF